jgi:hypothetical protein
MMCDTVVGRITLRWSGRAARGDGVHDGELPLAVLFGEVLPWLLAIPPLLVEGGLREDNLGLGDDRTRHALTIGVGTKFGAQGGPARRHCCVA